MLLAWYFYTVIQNNIHSDEDLVFGWISPFDLDWFWPFHLVIFSIAILFQIFVTLSVLSKYKKLDKIICLRLWQLILITCLLLGLCYSFADYSAAIPLTYFIEKAGIVSLLCIAYWAANLFTLKLIDKKFAPAQ